MPKHGCRAVYKPHHAQIRAEGGRGKNTLGWNANIIADYERMLMKEKKERIIAGIKKYKAEQSSKIEMELSKK